MRHDMKKLLCERPRIGSSAPSLKTHKRLNPNLDYDSGDYDWGPTCLPISRRRQFGYESKTLNENLNPLERFLRTAIGRAWDEVYSEIRENITPKKAIDFHVLFHLDFMVELHVEMFNGIPYHKKHSRWGRYEVTGLYVHPDTGILCLHERVQQDPAYTPKDALHWYGNFWFKKTIIKKTHCYTENFGKPEAKSQDEHSFLIHGKKGHDNSELKHFLQHHGEKYNQDSVLHKAHNEDHANLIGTNHSNFPGFGVHKNVGHWHPGRHGEFHTVAKGGGVNSGQQSVKGIR